MSKQDDLLFQLKDELRHKLTSNPELKAIFRKIQSGKATLDDTFKYSQISSELLGNFLSEKIESLSQQDREYICNGLLKAQHDDINRKIAKVQTNIDQKQGLHISPQKATFPTERVQQIAHSLIDPTVPIETIQRRANNSVANVSLSFHDDYIQENAKFRNNSGLKCYINRISDGKCCAWCSAIAGRYEYGKEPSDIYRRHDNCTCSVIFENGRQRQDVWSKKSWNVKPSVKDFKPTILSREQAVELQRQNLQYRGLSNNISYMSNSFRPVYSDKITSLKVDNLSIDTKSVKNSKFNLFTDVDETRRSKAVRLVEKNLEAISSQLPKGFSIPQTAVIDFESHGLNPNAIGGYHAPTGVMYINSKYDTSEKILSFVNKNSGFFANKTEYAPILHELGHKYYEDCVNSLAISQEISYNKAKDRIDNKISEYISSRNFDGRFVLSNISKYAHIGYTDHSYTEIIAECFSVSDSNDIAKDILQILEGN